MRSNYKRIGDYIRLVDVRNKDLSLHTLLGLSISKQFIPSVANTVGTNMANYKIIERNQFACSLMQVRRDKKIPIALLLDLEEAIISQAYSVFEIIDEKILSPEYLMMWFSRTEFDRNACFLAVGGVRGSLEWDDFCDMTLPVPSIEKQQEIVDEYKVIINRIKLNEELNQKLEETAQAIYKEWFVDFEFPITKEYGEAISKPELEGRPYKSNGGELVYNEELENDIPVGWRFNRINEFGRVITGKTPSSKTPGHFGNDILFVTPSDYKNYFKFVLNSERFLSFEGSLTLKNNLLPIGSIMVTCIGSDMGKVVVSKRISISNQQINSIIPFQELYTEFLYYILKDLYVFIKEMGTGSSTMPMINKTEFQNIKLLKPKDRILQEFDIIIKPLSKLIISYFEEVIKLKSVEELLLSK